MTVVILTYILQVFFTKSLSLMTALYAAGITVSVRLIGISMPA